MIQSETFEYMPPDGADYLRYTDFNSNSAHRNRLACIIQLIKDCHGEKGPLKILEIGCGVGNIALPLASLGHTVQAIDIHEPSVEIARQKNVFKNLTFTTTDVAEVDLSEFNVLILTEVLEHIKDYEKMLSDIARRMGKNAHFILTVPNGWGITEILCRPSYLLRKSISGSRAVDGIKKVLGTRDITSANKQTPHLIFLTLTKLLSLFDKHTLEIEHFFSLFFLWHLLETFFSEHKFPDKWPRLDMELSQRISPFFGACWIFLLKK